MKRKKEFPIPDSVLRDAYLEVATQHKCYREKFVARTECIEAVKKLIGPTYAHVPVDDIRARIANCAKNPHRHGDGWRATVNGHSATKRKVMSKEYYDVIGSDKFRKYASQLRKQFGNRCAMCNIDSQLETHHRTYETLGNESGFDCIPLCKKCHKVADVRRQREYGTGGGKSLLF